MSFTSDSMFDPTGFSEIGSYGLPARVILFDVDGTLINAARRIEYRVRIAELLEAVFGTCGQIDHVDFAGRTDLAIYRDALECEGIGPDVIRERVPVLEAAMVELLQELSASGEVFRLCPGVSNLLEALSRDRRFFPSLLTGNIEKLAEAKLRAVGIWHYFRGRGAYGSDAEERNLLPAIAAARISAYFGEEIDPGRFIVVGDTPSDIACARYFGARVLAVASGIFGVDELGRFEPDGLIQDLTDTSAVLELLARI